MAYIAVDIGHGNNTYPPSKGVRKGGKGYAEHDFNSKLGVAIKDLLEQQGHKVIFGQQPFKPDVPLRTRTNLYNREKVDLVISLHANWNNDSNVNGRCVFYWGTSSKSKALAVAIRDEIKKKGYSTHGSGLHAGERGSWTNLHINRETNMPAVLVEHGFMSGNKDFDLIFGSKKDQYIKDMAEADVRGIQKWLGDSYKGEATVKPTPNKPVKPSTPKPSKPSTGGSIVNYMNSKGMDSSYNNRAKLAKQHGISNYKGTASQNIELLNKLKTGSKPTPSKPTPSKPKPKPKTTGSIVDFMNSQGLDSSFNNRKRLAGTYGIQNYKGTATQNIKLLNKIKSGGSSKSTFNAQSIANQIKKGIDNRGRRIPNGHANRQRHFGLTSTQYAQVRRLVNK